MDTAPEARHGSPAGTPAWQVTGHAFRAAVESGRLDLPLPGSGRTRERWAAFAELAEEDLSLARLGEGHADAVAILAELDGPAPPPGSRWGVWAAHPPGPKLEARPQRGRMAPARHEAILLGRPLVHACPGHGGRARREAAVRGRGPGDWRRLLGTWPATGMAGSDTLDVDFDDVRASRSGRPGRTSSGPGSRTEAWGWPRAGTAVPARWGAPFWPPRSERDVGPHALAHLGAVDIALQHHARGSRRRGGRDRR